jgi:hypothetical protein
MAIATTLEPAIIPAHSLPPLYPRLYPFDDAQRRHGRPRFDLSFGRTVQKSLFDRIRSFLTISYFPDKSAQK